MWNFEIVLYWEYLFLKISEEILLISISFFRHFFNNLRVQHTWMHARATLITARLLNTCTPGQGRVSRVSFVHVHLFLSDAHVCN